MDLKTYLKNRDAKNMTEQTPSNQRLLCLKCMRPQKICFCHTLKSFDTNVAFRILMHPMEARKEPLGTGRLTNVTLNNCEIIVDKTFDQNKTVQDLIHSPEYFPMILYPGHNSLNLSTDKISTDFFQGRRPLVFVIDGTWPCAKSMMRDSHTLHHLPRISFDSQIESRFKIKQQPKKYCLSTIESIYHLLSCLEHHGIEKLGNQKEVLLDALQKLVEFQIKCASDPSLQNSSRKRSNGYKDPSQRVPSKKWLSRKVCFEGS